MEYTNQKRIKHFWVINLIAIVIRTFIIYCAVTLCIRLMGKRQLGELQPGELVITMLISEIAATPITETDQPLIYSIIPLMLLVSFEIINSVISIKSPSFRYKVDGRPITIINNGKLNQRRLNDLRFTIDDVLCALRQKDVFDITQVECAIAETNGTLTVLLKQPERQVTQKLIGKNEKDQGIPFPVIIDGKILENSIKDTPANFDDVIRKVENEGLRKEDILLMTVDKNKKYTIIKKDKGS